MLNITDDQKNILNNIDKSSKKIILLNDDKTDCHHMGWADYDLPELIMMFRRDDLIFSPFHMFGYIWWLRFGDDQSKEWADILGDIWVKKYQGGFRYSEDILGPMGALNATYAQISHEEAIKELDARVIPWDIIPSFPSQGIDCLYFYHMFDKEATFVLRSNGFLKIYFSHDDAREGTITEEDFQYIMFWIKEFSSEISMDMLRRWGVKSR